MKRTALSFIALVFFFNALEQVHADENPRQVATKMLRHLGEEAPWAQARGVRIFEVHISQYSRLPYTHEVWIDFMSPRVLVRGKNHDFHYIRSMNGGEGWWLQDGKLEPYEEDFLMDEYARWRASPYRVLHLIARNDPSLSYRMAGQGTLEIAIDGEAVTQFELDGDYTPVGFRRHNNDFESLAVLGPITEYGRVSVWKEVGTEDRTAFRSLNLEFELTAAPPGISFDPPEDLNDLSR